jgi:hypothetical protein
VAYESDIFVSYRRTETVGRWVRNHFAPRLNARLNENSGRPVNVYCDFLIEEGDDWARALKEKLQTSRILVAIWSADYFRSPWCMAEWQSFRERERLAQDGAGATQSLVYPIRYADGDEYHPDAKATQCSWDFTTLNYPDEVFRQSVKWLEFEDMVTRVALDLIARLHRVPEWRGDFPIVQPAPLPEVIMRRPVL